jgi:hypothetical protein
MNHEMNIDDNAELQQLPNRVVNIHQYNTNNVDKGIQVREWSQYELSQISSEDDNSILAWYFSESLSTWTPTSHLSKCCPYIKSLDSLRYEGSFCHQLKVWKRFYITKFGVCVQLIEDIPESGGQNCLWSAGIILSEYFQSPLCGIDFRGKKVLELGSGNMLLLTQMHL